MDPRYRKMIEILIPVWGLNEKEAKAVFGLKDSIQEFTSGKTSITKEHRERLEYIVALYFLLLEAGSPVAGDTEEKMIEYMQEWLRKENSDFSTGNALTLIQGETSKIEYLCTYIGEMILWTGY